MSCYLNFLVKDAKEGMLKLGRAGMIRRTLSFKGGVMFEGFSFLPFIKRVIIVKELKGGIKE